MNNLDDLRLSVANEKSIPEAGVQRYSLALQIGFFSDFRERNIIEDEDGGHLANTGRIYKFHPEDWVAELNSDNVKVCRWQET